ncbi:molybdate ABC transporter substrate-binding protein [uncultured Jatrophihabitans sp.]|uniref:molybdate ABC transporter substrate-binding protein n=1 Tax=uncultured Jatrophihabitans sp. TaxID=1610747 RepID=UPI0035CB77CD
MIVAVLAVTLAACSSSSSTSSTSGSTSSGGAQSSSSSALKGSITVDAAASLTGAFNTLKAQFIQAHPGTSVTTMYAASSALAAQITQGAPVDVFASAAPKNMDTVVKAGDASSPVNFVSNSGQIAVPPSNPGKVTKLADLAKSNVKVGLCAPAVPCGVVARAAFAKARIKVTPKANFADVKTTLAAVESGNVDAGIVYITDVKAAGPKVKGITIDPSVNATTEYPIAALTHAKNPALAKAWVSFVQSPTGQQVLAQAGFAKP